MGVKRVLQHLALLQSLQVDHDIDPYKQAKNLGCILYKFEMGQDLHHCLEFPEECSLV
jgi:hypothetical protein